MNDFADSRPYEPSLNLSRTPLRLIFWGGLLCVIDFHFSWISGSSGFKIDILNDLLGMVLITVGVFRLEPICATYNLQTPIQVIEVVAVISCLEAAVDHFIFEWPGLLSFSVFVFGLLKLGAILIFCITMSRLCIAEELLDAARSWKTTTVLFAVIYVVPLGLFYAAAAVAIAFDKSLNIDLGVAGLLLIPVFIVPLIHFFVSSSRMIRSVNSVV